MTGIIDVVDSTIGQARTLLGTGQPATPPPPHQPNGTPPQPQQWTGTAANRASTVTDLLHLTRGQLTHAQTRAIIAMSVGPDIAHTGHSGLDVIEAGWQSEKNLLGPYADTPEGQAALIEAAMGRISDTQSLVVETTNQYGIAGDAIREALGDLPNPEDPTESGDAPTPEETATTDPELTDLADHDLPDDLETSTSTDVMMASRTAPDVLHSAAVDPSQAAAMAQGMPMGSGMPMGAGMPMGGMPGGGMPTGGIPAGGLQSMLQPLTDAAESLGAENPTQADRDHDRDHDPSTGAKVVEHAERGLGLPYIWGGGGATGPTGGGFDCSGLAQFAVAQATDGQVILPRQTYDQIKVGQTITPSEARPGDLVFSNFSSRGPEHVQIFAGHGQVIEAQQSGVPVKYSNAPTGHIVVKRVI